MKRVILLAAIFLAIAVPSGSKPERRATTSGPQFIVADGNQFQDTFDMLLTGRVRIDQATDILPPNNPNILPGDSATATIFDPDIGLATDPNTGFGPAVYMYIALWPQSQPSKRGAAMTDDALRWPLVDSLVHNGTTWYCIRADTVFLNGATRTGVVDDRWCVDLNDNLFEPGDTICFVWSATSTGGAFTSYYSRETGITSGMAAFDTPDEVTILPAGGVANGGDYLYIDAAGGDEQQEYDAAFAMLRIGRYVDRYDVREPESGLGNRPGSRIDNVSDNILPYYRQVIWSSGSQDVVLGEGTTSGPDKSPDIQFLSDYLDLLQIEGLLFLDGDNFAEALDALPQKSTLKFFIEHNLTAADASSAGFGTAPICIGETGGGDRAFQHLGVPDSLIAFAGSPTTRRFDVLEPVGVGPTTQMTYGAADHSAPNGESTNSSVIFQITNNSQGQDVFCFLSGVSFGAVADMAPAEVPISVHYLRHILTSGSTLDDPVSARNVPVTTALAQNYPNPFNPATTIAFSLARGGNVSLAVYTVSGQLVRHLVRESRGAGAHAVTWDGRDGGGQSVASGVYFYRLTAGRLTQTRKMVLLK